ncbi:MAG: asparagine synthase (glutamine-hydrolyzing) [Gammaproteobacteria bacterium]|jgi:asparagine synthase (glutamine-hydrolysing)
MCGIAAVWGKSAPDLAHTIAERMAHRGPDGQGAIQLDKPQLSLAHRRLAIIDPAGGRQPLVAVEDEGAMVANGMIYNDRALRESLDDSHFITESDSESILQTCLRDGAGAVSRLDGMFAFVMARGGDQLIVARDPVGIKPLYVGRRGETFCFASEIKALLPYVDEVREFPPGHVFDSKRGLRPYYTLPRATDELSNPANALEAIRKTLTRAIEKRLRSDVPLGVFLSGGLDSSIIAAVAVQARPGLKSFSVGLPGSPDLEAARRVAKHLGTDHYEYELSAEEVMRDLPRILYHLESFDRDLVRSAVPCYYVSRLAAQHVKVVLTGEGADELFAGYTYHKSYDDLDALQAELRRSVLTMHDINLQRVDRMTMAHGVEARVPFLDRDMLDLAFRIPAALKLPQDTKVEKWILRKAFEDLLPTEIVWRAKAQFDQGSGIAELLEAEVMAQTQGTSVDDLPRPARNSEEAFYRAALIGQFDKPSALLDLVAHWDDDVRVTDGPVAATATPTQLYNGRVDSSVALDDFSALYDVPTPRPYFRRMSQVDYQIPGGANGIFEWCLKELRRLQGSTDLKVLDLCAGYGVNGALMKLDLSLDELYRYFADLGDPRTASALFDRAFLATRIKDPNVHVTGLDVAANALDYARAAGFINDGHAVNLEIEPLPARLEATIAQCSLISITGGFSFIGATTFDKILSTLPQSSTTKPWIVGFPLLHTDLDALIEVLGNHGYVIQPDSQYRFLQRQFASNTERVSEHTALARADLKVVDNNYFESRLLVAQPPGMPAIPEAILKLSAEYDLGKQRAVASA